jgi:hypothetical protein
MKKFGAYKRNDSSEKRVFYMPRVVAMSNQRAMNKVIGDVHSTLVSGIRFVNLKIENV